MSEQTVYVPHTGALIPHGGVTRWRFFADRRAEVRVEFGASHMWVQLYPKTHPTLQRYEWPMTGWVVAVPQP
jgi:hypothetical protein